MLRVQGSAPQGAEGLDGHLDLARFHSSFFDVFTELSVSGGYATLGDGTTVSGIDLDPVTESFITPEPGSLATLLTGAVGLLGFGIRRKKTS